MGKFVNDQTGVTVSVADHKDERFSAGWTQVGNAPTDEAESPDEEPAPAPGDEPVDESAPARRTSRTKPASPADES